MNREVHNIVHTLMPVVEEAARSFSDQRWRLVVLYQAARNRNASEQIFALLRVVTEWNVLL